MEKCPVLRHSFFVFTNVLNYRRRRNCCVKFSHKIFNLLFHETLPPSVLPLSLNEGLEYLDVIIPINLSCCEEVLGRLDCVCLLVEPLIVMAPRSS